MDGLPSVGVLPMAIPADPVARLSTLFEAHYERLYGLARRMTSTADDALDLVQETFLKAARAPRSIPTGFNAEEAWLVRVLINIRRDQWRKQAVRRRYAGHSRTADQTADGHESAVIARATVWSALDELTPRRRAVVVFHELEGQSIETIASLLGISRITVRWHLVMGRRDLARAINP